MNRPDLVTQRQHPVYQLVALLEELGEAVLVTDRQACLLHLSLSAQRMLGVLGNDVRGSGLGDWIAQFAAENDVAQALESYAMIPGASRRELTVTLQPRGAQAMEAGFVVCRTEMDEETTYVCLLRDLAEIRRVETQMLDAQRLVRSVLQNTSEGYLLIDAAGMIMDVNPAFEAMCSRNAMDLLETHFSTLFDERNRLAMEALLERLDRGRAASAEISFQRENGSQVLGLFKGALLFDARNERVGVFGLITDITETKAKETQIQQLAFFDPLTELANRTMLRDKLEQAIVFSQRSKRKFALLFLDLDRFKHVNDTFTHLFGDQLLQQVAQRIRQVVRRSDVVARFGGDEFVVCLVEPRRSEDWARVGG
jgi:PAS domain S-box-containing protein